MELSFRETRLGDIDDLFSIRARTRENPLSKEQLAFVGITPEATAAGFSSARAQGWVCLHGSTLVGFCNADPTTGEVLVLAVLSQYEGRGVGKRLLVSTVSALRAAAAGKSGWPPHPTRAFARPDSIVRSAGGQLAKERDTQTRSWFWNRRPNPASWLGIGCDRPRVGSREQEPSHRRERQRRADPIDEAIEVYFKDRGLNGWLSPE